MVISSKDLIGLPVLTQMDQELGKISGFDLDVDTQRIKHYHVKKHSILAELLGEKDLIISESQVISITKVRMTVEDAVVGGEAQIAKLRRKVAGSTSV